MTTPVFAEPQAPDPEPQEPAFSPLRSIVVGDPTTMTPPNGAEFWFDDDMFETDEEGLPRPSFAVAEVAKVFFGRGADWLRWRMRSDNTTDRVTGEVILGKHPDGWFTLDGVPFVGHRKADYAKGMSHTRGITRIFTLADIERMAHGLAQNGGIDGNRLHHIIATLVHIGYTYGILIDGTAYPELLVPAETPERLAPIAPDPFTLD